MTNHIVVGGINEKQNEIMYDLMQPEAAGLEEIFEDPTYRVKEAYDELRGEHMEVEDALGFTYLIKDDEEYDIMEALNKLYKSGLSLAKIKRAMDLWQTEFYTDIWSHELEEYKEYIITKRERIKGSNQDNIEKKRRIGALGEIEKRMNFHMKWGFTKDILKKFEKKNKAVTKIQSRFKGNKDRQMLEKSGLWYQDATSHWKKKNKSKIVSSLLREMIDDTMTDARKAEVREEIRTFLLDKGFASKKKKTKKKSKKSKKKTKKSK